MKKTHIRDYATAAFRFYAATGSSERYKQAIWDRAIQEQHRVEGRSGISNPSEAAVLRAEKEVENALAEIADLEAVEFTLHIIESMNGGNDMMKALKMVYMAEPNREPIKGEISQRVHKAELNIPASERSIYGWLGLARSIFAEERGLRV